MFGFMGFTRLYRPHKLQALKARVFTSPHHRWIHHTPLLKKNLELFFDRLDESTLDFLVSGDEMILLAANGKLSCTLSSIDRAHIVILFPDLIKYLCSPLYTLGFSILAHEIGHIVNKHSKRKIHPLAAQFEADRFVCKLNLREELMAVLEDYPHSEECRLRLQKLKEIRV